MKKINILIALVLVFAIINSCKFGIQNTGVTKESNEINNEDFDKLIKRKPYTILYFWASWCGFSQAGLINDYSKNYQQINNDTVQSLLIVSSDTNSIRSFMEDNNINLPYKCLYEGNYSIITRNIKDGENMEGFIKDMFGYKILAHGFPTILLVDSSFTVLMESDETLDAVRIYRYFEHQKLLKNKKSP